MANNQPKRNQQQRTQQHGVWAGITWAPKHERPALTIRDRQGTDHVWILTPAVTSHLLGSLAKWTALHLLPNDDPIHTHGDRTKAAQLVNPELFYETNTQDQ